MTSSDCRRTRRIHLLTDAGLGYLKSMTNLQRIEIAGTKVSESKILELKAALPNLTVYR
jgi:hypothetical protein